ncbi:MAG: sulfite exporter TauE/SafE family protein [Verrucomicrobiota bacterium]
MDLPAAFAPLLTTTWLLALVAALCVGIAKGGLGGFALITVVIMAEIMPPKQSVGVVLLLYVIGDAYSVRAFGRHAQWKYVWSLLPPLLVGAVIGALLLDVIPPGLFKRVLGLVVLSMVVLQLLRYRCEALFERLARSRRYVQATGVAGGVCTMLANAAGPLLQMYFLTVRLEKFTFIGTMAVLFCLLNLCKLPLGLGVGILGWNTVFLVLLLAPAVVLGVILGKALISFIPQQVFEWLVLAFAALTALHLMMNH